MLIRLRVYDYMYEQMLYSEKPYDQGKREYYPFMFGIGFSGWDKDNLSELMLSTGLKDCLGNEVYEGDILQDISGNYNLLYWRSSNNCFLFWNLNPNLNKGIENPSNRVNRAFSVTGYADMKVVSNIYECTGAIKDLVKVYYTDNENRLYYS